MPTHIVKYNNDTNELTAYCDDDKTKTEIGPARWNTSTKQLEIHCGGNVYPVKWNNVEKRLEARNVSADCCCEYNNGCTDCYSVDQTPVYIKVTFNNIVDCGNGYCDWADGDFILSGGGNCSWSYSATNQVVILLIHPITGHPNTEILAYKSLPYETCFLSYGGFSDCTETSNIPNNSSSCVNVEGKDGVAAWSIYPAGC
jgi:hypothetical protein